MAFLVPGKVHIYKGVTGEGGLKDEKEKEKERIKKRRNEEKLTKTKEDK